MNIIASTLQVFEPAMCCSTGVCGPAVDPRLVQFAADLEWLKSQGVIVQRHSLSQNPAAFVANEIVRSSLTERGEAALPLMLRNGKVVFVGRYPNLGELAGMLNLRIPPTQTLPPSGDCCEGQC